jgi:hypothetical protein
MEQIKPDKRYLLAKQEDLRFNVSLKQSSNNVDDFNNTRLISLSELFTKERNESTKYRIYGNINYFSFIRNKKTNPSDLTDIFNDDYLTNGFNFEDFFDLKILRPLTKQNYFNNTNTYIEKLTAVTNTNDYNLNFFCYGKNVYNEKIYNFKFISKNFDPNEIVRIDNDFIYSNNIYLGFIPRQNPNYTLYEKVIENDYINELNSATTYGYEETAFTSNIQLYIPIINTNSNFTNLEFRNYFLDKLNVFFRIYNLTIDLPNINRNLRFIRNYLDIGNGDYKTKALLDIVNIDIFTGSSYNFDKENYSFNKIIEKEYLIKYQLIDVYDGPSEMYASYNEFKNKKGYTSFTFTETDILANNIVKKEIKIDFWLKFNPFYKIELKKYDSVTNEIFDNIETELIPPPTAIIDGNRITWKDLLLYGDPENYDNPFINNTHYFYNDINFYLKPDLSDKNTFILINEFLLKFGNNNFKFNTNNINLKPEGPKEIC